MLGFLERRRYSKEYSVLTPEQRRAELIRLYQAVPVNQPKTSDEMVEIIKVKTGDDLSGATNEDFVEDTYSQIVEGERLSKKETRALINRYKALIRYGFLSPYYRQVTEAEFENFTTWGINITEDFSGRFGVEDEVYQYNAGRVVDLARAEGAAVFDQERAKEIEKEAYQTASLRHRRQVADSYTLQEGVTTYSTEGQIALDKWARSYLKYNNEPIQ